MQYCIIQIYSLQLIMLIFSLQKAINLMVKHIARSHFLGVFLQQNELSQKTTYGKAVIKILDGNASLPVTFILLITGGP